MKNPLVINPKQEKDKIVKFLKKIFKEQKINKVVLGLSGGVDSTVALYLLKEVLPAKNIYAVQMDYKPRKKIDINLEGVNVVNISIKKIVDNFEAGVEGLGVPTAQSRGISSEASTGGKRHETGPAFNKVRLGNIMARVRMIILFDLSKKLGGLVCGTENKSEKLLGYFTRFGDAASDLEPLSHLYKTQVYQLAHYLKVPEAITSQSPTAGLWAGQTDENDFGFTYSEADLVLYQVVDLKKNVKELKKNFPNFEKIIMKMRNNQFKQATPYTLK